MNVACKQEKICSSLQALKAYFPIKIIPSSLENTAELHFTLILEIFLKNVEYLR